MLLVYEEMAPCPIYPTVTDITGPTPDRHNGERLSWLLCAGRPHGGCARLRELQRGANAKEAKLPF